MIAITPEQIFGVFVTMWVGLIVYLWLRDEFFRPSDDWTTTKDWLYTCSRCHFTFLSKNDMVNVTRCPNCNSICLLRKKKHF